jgi:hypothetical protein
MLAMILCSAMGCFRTRCPDPVPPIAIKGGRSREDPGMLLHLEIMASACGRNPWAIGPNPWATFPDHRRREPGFLFPD